MLIFLHPQQNDRSPVFGNAPGSDTLAWVSDPGALPKTGDLSFCWGCKKISIFTVIDGYTYVRQPRPDEQAEIDSDPTLQRALAAFVQHDSVREARDAVTREMTRDG